MPGGMGSEQVKATRAEVNHEPVITIFILERAPRPRTASDLVPQHDRDSAT